MLQSVSPVLALYDPFGVDVPLNCDTTTTTGVDVSLDNVGKTHGAHSLNYKKELLLFCYFRSYWNSFKFLTILYYTKHGLLSRLL